MLRSPLCDFRILLGRKKLENQRRSRPELTKYLWMRDITVQHVATPHSRVHAVFSSGAVRSTQLLPLQLRPLVVAQPFPQAVGGELNPLANVEAAVVRDVEQNELRRGRITELAQLPDL